MSHAPIIIRASAVEYERSPEDPDVRTIGMPASLIRFEVEEVVKDADIPGSLVLPGYLQKRDDWNDHEPPYTFVRPGGRGGSCWANSYREGGQFLLFLQKLGDEIKLFPSALAPVNEQLMGARDPWLFWVKGFVAAQAKENGE